MSESTYTVTGMTCGHCASSVTEEIGEITGVQKVQVDLSTGNVTVTSDRELSHDEIRSAVTDAGYQLAS
jgi:copper chaperone